MSFMSGDQPPDPKSYSYALPEGGQAGNYILDSDMNFIRNALLEIRTALGSLQSSLNVTQTAINTVGARIAALEAGLPPPADTIAPTPPSNLTATEQTTTSVRLTWTAATDAVGVTGYIISRPSAADVTTTGTSTVITGLSASTQYTFTIVARDAAGNRSQGAVVTTSTTAPTVGGSVSLVASSTSVTADGTVTLTANVTPAGSNTVTQVEFFEGSTLIGMDTAAPYTAVVSYTVADNGAHAYTARASFSAGTPATSSAVTVTVNIATSTGTTTNNRYVSTSGSDTAAGTQAAPWRTVQYALDNSPQDCTIHIRGGTYPERCVLRVSGSGESTRIYVQPFGYGTGSQESVLFDYASLGTITDGVPFLDINSRQYVTFRGLTWQNYTCRGLNQRGVRIDGTSQFITLESCRFLNNRLTAPDLSFNEYLLHCHTYGPAHDITIRSCDFTNIKAHAAECLAFDSAAHDSLVEDCHFQFLDTFAINLRGGSFNITLRHNDFDYVGLQQNGTTWYNTPAYCILNDGGHDNTIERNSILHCNWGIGIWSEPTALDGEDVLVRNNVIRDCTHAGLQAGNPFSSDTTTIRRCTFVNNTVYNCATGMMFRPFESSLIWKNNIIAECDNAWASSGFSGPYGDIQYNHFHNNGGTTIGSSNTSGDPLFVNVGAADFRLQNGSPCINSGDPSLPSQVVGSVDFAGATRVVGGRADKGAHESTSLSQPVDGFGHAAVYVTAQVATEPTWGTSAITVNSALADGVTDVRAQLQAAFDQAFTEGKHVILPPGASYYRITAPLVLRTSISSPGGGGTRPRIHTTNASTGFTNQGDVIIIPNGASNIWVKNLWITGTYTNGHPGTEDPQGISLGSVDRVVIRYCRIENIRGDCIGQRESLWTVASPPGSRNVIIRDNELINPFRCAVGWIWHATTWHVIDNFIDKDNAADAGASFVSGFDIEPEVRNSVGGNVSNIEVSYNRFSMNNATQNPSRGADGRCGFRWQVPGNANPGGNHYIHHNYGDGFGTGFWGEGGAFGTLVLQQNVLGANPPVP